MPWCSCTSLLSHAVLSLLPLAAPCLLLGKTYSTCAITVMLWVVLLTWGAGDPSEQPLGAAGCCCLPYPLPGQEAQGLSQPQRVWRRKAAQCSGSGLACPHKLSHPFWGRT